MRWGNVALALTVLGALAGVIVWPLVGAATPALPPDTARPLVATEGRGEVETSKPPREAKPKARVAHRAPSHRRARRPAKRRAPDRRSRQPAPRQKTRPRRSVRPRAEAPSRP